MGTDPRRIGPNAASKPYSNVSAARPHAFPARFVVA
jgi:hypothetical protein